MSAKGKVIPFPGSNYRPEDIRKIVTQSGISIQMADGKHITLIDPTHVLVHDANEKLLLARPPVGMEAELITRVYQRELECEHFIRQRERAEVFQPITSRVIYSTSGRRVLYLVTMNAAKDAYKVTHVVKGFEGKLIANLVPCFEVENHAIWYLNSLTGLEADHLVAQLSNQK